MSKTYEILGHVIYYTKYTTVEAKSRQEAEALFYEHMEELYIGADDVDIDEVIELE